MIKYFRRNFVRWSALGLLVIALIATAVFTGVKYENAKTSVKINNMEQAKQYLESHAFDNISMMKFYRQVFVYNNSSSTDQKMKLEDFKIGLDTNYKVRLMSMKVIDTSNAELKSYSIQYDRNADYFNVTKKQEAENEIRPVVTTVLTRLDQYKNLITFPNGDYCSYYLNFYLSGSIGPGANLYALNEEGLHVIKDRNLEGLIFVVYGDPIKNEDSPNYYIMPY
ncbi:MAG TPA: hypothetical protein VFC84_05755 [Desulfosporosinus sp.]|nr:hypothetical protein [Desulfosporosinus sp.]